MLFTIIDIMKLFRRKKYYVDHSTKVPAESQIGSRKRPFGSLFQVASAIEKDESVTVVMVKNGKRQPSFTFSRKFDDLKPEEKEKIEDN